MYETEYNLFNQPKEFNLSMIKELKDKNLDNPSVQVVWEDNPDNFSQERIKRIKSYFQKKYNTKNVNIVTKIVTDNRTYEDIDFKFNVLDENYQKSLIKEYLSEYDEEFIDEILTLDNSVNHELSEEKSDYVPFKKWFIKNIKFSNFLSYGEGQVVNYEDYEGVTVIKSDPPNFGGKTILAVDLLLFLFFNTTTKTSKSEEIFNRFTNLDKVSVQGEIVIDGEDYIISREIKRTKKRKGTGYTIKTSLDFMKKFKDGSIQNFTGEQRRETESFIKKSIGNYDDFLNSILTTGSNLESLLDAKPTARGEILSRFMGLDIFKEKEGIAKTMYSTFSKQMLSNVFDINTLKDNILSYRDEISNIKKQNGELDESIKKCEGNIKKGNSFRDDLIMKKNTHVDDDLQKTNESEILEDISRVENKLTEVRSKIKDNEVKKPKGVFDENEYDALNRENNDMLVQKFVLETQIETDTETLKEYEGGFKCGHCGLILRDSEHNERLKKTNQDNTNKLKEIEKVIKDNDKKLEKMKTLQEEFDVYERSILILDRYNIEEESEKNKLENLQNKLKRFNNQQKLIEENKKIDGLVVKADIRLDELHKEKSGYETEKTKNLSEIKSLNEKIDESNNNIQKIEDEYEKDKVYKKYLEIFGKNGLTKVIMKKMIPVINSELSRLLSESAHFRVEVIVNDKNEVEFDMIDNETQIRKPMVSGSGFEKTIASLALRSVLSKISSLPKPDVMVFDEVFGKVSNENLEKVFEFFDKIKKYFPKIFVITHNELISQWSSKSISITKDNNISKVV